MKVGSGEKRREGAKGQMPNPFLFLNEGPSIQASPVWEKSWELLNRWGGRHDMLRTLAFATKPTDSGARLTRFKSLIFQWLTVWPWASDPTSLLGWAQEEPREGFQQVGTGWYNWVCKEMGWKEPVWVWRVVICNYTPDPNRLLQSGLVVNVS